MKPVEERLRAEAENFDAAEREQPGWTPAAEWAALLREAADEIGDLKKQVHAYLALIDQLQGQLEKDDAI